MIATPLTNSKVFFIAFFRNNGCIITQRSIVFKKKPYGVYLQYMGTETFPMILLLIKIILGVVIAVAVLLIILGAFEFYTHKGDKKKEEEAKTRITDSLIAIAIILVVYLFFTGIGPAYRLIMIKAV